MASVGLFWLLACAPAPQDSALLTPEAPIALDNAALLRRASLDLRGRPPTLEELDRLAEDPSVLPCL